MRRLRLRVKRARLLAPGAGPGLVLFVSQSCFACRAILERSADWSTMAELSGAGGCTVVGFQMSARQVRSLSGRLDVHVVGDGDGAISGRFGVGMFPALVVIDQAGRAGRPAPVPDVDQLLERIRSHAVTPTPAGPTIA